MLENFIFENHLGQRFVGLENGVFMNYNELRDYSWSHDTINNRISRFYRGVTSRKLPLVVCCGSDEEATAVKNEITELAEADIDAKLPGKIFVGDYYTVGYITASKKSEYLITKSLCYIELTFTSDDPVWYKETANVFSPDSGDPTGTGNGTDYPYDYSYDYSLSLQGKKLSGISYGTAAFRWLIYGEAVNPSIVIGGHVYTINGTVGQGESLLVDSLNKTITLTTANGNKVNWFDKRGREYYIFEPIKPNQTVSWNGSFGFDLTVIEKRSEPKWT